MSGKRELEESRRSGIRELLTRVTSEDEILRNFTMVRRLSRLKSAIFLPVLVTIQLLLFMVQVLLRSDDLEFVGWPEIFKWYDRYVVAATSKGLVVARIVNSPLFAQRLGTLVRIDPRRIIQVDFDADADGGDLRIFSGRGNYKFKVEGEGWVRRAKQLVSIVDSW